MMQNHSAIRLPESWRSGRKQSLPYKERVRAAIRRALKIKPMEFSGLLGTTLNCDPVIVNSILCEEISNRKVTILEDVRDRRFYVGNGEDSEASDRMPALERQISSGTPESTSAIDGERSITPKWLASLPQASPVFSQWWFAPASCPQILRLIATGHPTPQRAAFLGRPTLAAIYSQVAAGRTAVLDVDAEILQSLSSQFGPTADVITYDAARGLASDLKGAFDLVFSDPPWSRSSLRLFVKRASELAREGAIVVISFPQALTRPGLQFELAALTDFAAQSGLHLEKQVPAATEYVVPEFEHRAYLNAGIQLTVPWRKGDLFFFRKTLPAQRRQNACEDYAPSRWWQTRLGESRVFLCPDDRGDQGAPSILPVPGNAGFVCTTTSSRSHILQQASVVTTYNEVGIVHNWHETRDRLISAKVRLNGAFQRSGPCPRPESLIALAASFVEGQLPGGRR
jgi:hypothetical protein